MAGAQHEEFSYDTFSATRKNFTSDNFNLALGSSKDQETGAATWAETLRSVYGRLSYVYNDRYMLRLMAGMMELLVLLQDIVGDYLQDILLPGVCLKKILLKI